MVNKDNRAALRLAGLAALLLLALALPLRPAEAQSTGVTFTLALPSAFARVAPVWGSPRAASLFQGQTYTANARSADGGWLRLNYSGAPQAWIPISFGTVNGDVSSLAVASGEAASPPTPAPTPLPGQTAVPTAPTAVPPGVYQPVGLPAIPTVSQTARDIYQRGLQLGNNPRAFSKVGDCQSVTPYFLASFDYGNYTLGPYADLQGAIDQFSGSWARESIATNRGFNVATVFVPLWADPARCLRNENPLACEFRLNRPSIAIITMETWWGGNPAGYESYLRRIIEYAIARGTVPIVGTKADNIEGNGSINAVIVKLAQEYDIPLWNFWAAVQPLPNQGLHPDGFHLTWERNYYDQPGVLDKSWPVRNLTALQAIEAVWRGVQ
jgi:hypothetical protein